MAAEWYQEIFKDIVIGVLSFTAGLVVNKVKEERSWKKRVGILKEVSERQHNAHGLAELEVKIGTAEHKLCEDMVREGLIDRTPFGGYCLPSRLGKM